MSKKKAKVVPVVVQKTPEPKVEPSQAPEVTANAVPEVQADPLQSAVVAANEQMEQKAHAEPEAPSVEGFEAYGKPSIDAPCQDLHPVQKEADIK